MDRRIVLLGKTGSGKSATGNTILRGEYFKHEYSPASVTKKCEAKTLEHISVVDTPGMFDTNLSEDQLKHEIKECVKMSVPGPHVFLLVIRLGRFTEEEKNAVKWIQENFGEDASRYTIVLFTHADQLGNRTIEEYLKESPELRRIINTCNGRYCVFNNNDQQSDQVQNLMQKIDDVVKMNGGKHDTNEMYEQAQRELHWLYWRTTLKFVAHLAVIAAMGAAIACLATIASTGLAGTGLAGTGLAGAGLATTAGVGAAVACLAAIAAVGAAVACLAVVAGTGLAGAGLATTAAVGAAGACLATIPGTGLAGASLVAAGLATTAAVGAVVARLATPAAVGAAGACLATIAGTGVAVAGLAGAGLAAVSALAAVLALKLVEM